MARCTRTWIFSKAALAGALIAALGGWTSAYGQRMIFGPGAVRPVPESKSEKDSVENVFLPPDRAILQQLSRAKELLDEERYGDAVRYLGAILDNPEDFFFQPDKDAPIHRSLKGEAQRLIGSMPKKGLSLYQLRFGATAKRLFDEAILDGDAERLAEVSRRFFHTEAGYEATLVLGLDHLHHARPLAAALTLQRLREAPRAADRFEPTLSLAAATAWTLAGTPDKAREILGALKDLQQGQPIQIAGKSVAMFAKKNDSLEWLAGIIGSQRVLEKEGSGRWAMFRGSASRNAATDGGTPLLNMRWQIPVTDDPAVDESLRQYRQQCLDQDIPTLPGLHPLVVDDVVLMRTFRNLLAVDFKSGKRLWEAPVDDPLESLLLKAPAEAPFRQQAQPGDGFSQRVLGDATYGTMSSDGQLVFTIEDLPITGALPLKRSVIVGGQQVQNPGQATCNRLAAHDIRTGKLKWHVGGPADQFALRLPETFFLGAPLPLLGQIYVLAESKGEGAIVLMALDAKKGDLLWSQPLAVVEQTLQEDPLRRTSGVAPSYADGVLVCPTSVGAVVAVELATRSLLWGYRYGRNDGRMPMAAMRFNAAQPSGGTAPYRWADATAVIAEGRVLLTPLESDALHCLNLIDGKLLWSYTRQDELYLACVDGDNVVLVGRSGVKALRLSNGKAAWEGRKATFPEGSCPTGRGFFSKNQYFVPLSNAAVMAVDLKSGRAVHTSIARKGNVPGNLICYKGKVISQAMESLDAFYQVDSIRAEVDRRLAANPEDSGALALRGEILLDEGNRTDAVACFRRAYTKDHDPRMRGVLRDALLDGLKLEFATYRKNTEEIEALLDDDVQRAAFLRLMAAGLHQAGAWSEAYAQYSRLIELDKSGRRIDEISPSLSVRRDRWVRTQLAGLMQEINDPKAQREIENRIEGRLDEALRSGDPASLQSFLDYFGALPVARRARYELFRRWMEADRIIEAEMLLWSDYQSADPAIACPATARMAELMQKAGRTADAAACYARLGGQLADAPCLDGKTGRHLVEALSPDSPLRPQAKRGDAWPEGLVEVSHPKLKGPRQPAYGRYGVDYEGSRDPFFTDVNVFFDQNQRAIFARDGLGSELWKLSLNERQQQNIFFNRTMTEGSVHGHLLLVSMGSKLMAIDAAGNAANRGAKLLWDQDMINPGSGDALLRQAAMFQNGLAMPRAAWAFQQTQIYRMNNRMSGVGPITHDLACFQRFRSLVAVDPLSGETLWTAGNVPAGSELFGDSQYVFALPPNEKEALVFRALDGTLLGKRKIPRDTFSDDVFADSSSGTPGFAPFSQVCIATFGRQTLLWRRDGKGRTKLELFDPWLQRYAWPARSFADGAAVALLNREAVGVCERSGRFMLISLPDGRTLIDTKLTVDDKEKLTSVQQIMLERFEDKYLLIATTPPIRSSRSRNIQPLPGLTTQPITKGWIFAFDADGKPAWPKPALIENQHLLPNQPAGTPVLTFACQDYSRNGSTARNQLLVKCFDKRTGRVVYDKKDDSATAVFDVLGNPKEKKVELRMQQKAVCLTFTDKPIPPEDEKTKTAEQSGAAKGLGTAEAILRALGKIAEKSVNPNSQDTQDTPAGAEDDPLDSLENPFEPPAMEGEQ